MSVPTLIRLLRAQKPGNGQRSHNGSNHLPPRNRCLRGSGMEEAERRSARASAAGLYTFGCGSTALRSVEIFFALCHHPPALNSSIRRASRSHAFFGNAPFGATSLSSTPECASRTDRTARAKAWPAATSSSIRRRIARHDSSFSTTANRIRRQGIEPPLDSRPEPRTVGIQAAGHTHRDSRVCAGAIPHNAGRERGGARVIKS